MNRQAIEDPFLTDAELAQILGISRAMVQKMRSQGMPSHAFGRSRRYRLSEAVDWAAERQDAA